MDSRRNGPLIETPAVRFGPEFSMGRCRRGPRAVAPGREGRCGCSRLMPGAR